MIPVTQATVLRTGIRTLWRLIIHNREVMLGKRKNVLDNASALVDIMQGLMDEMRAAFAAGDAVAVDRIYNQMVR